MHREVFLLKGIHPKKTGRLLGNLSKNNFPRIEYIKRVKNISKDRNLVIIDRVPKDHLDPFLSLFELNSDLMVQMKTICKETLNSKIKSLEEGSVAFDKVLSIFKDLESNETIHVLLISRFHKSMVRF